MKLLLIFGLLGLASAVSYSGDQIIRVLPREHKDFEWLERLENRRGTVEFLRPTSVQGLRTPVPVHIRIPRVNVDSVRSLLDHAKIEYKVMTADMQVLIDNQFDSPTRHTKQGDDYNYSEYHTYDEILTWADDIAFSYPSIAKTDLFTYSSEERYTPMLTIGASTASRSILVVCGAHAREWISPAVCQCLVGRLTEQYGYDNAATNMVDKISWTFIPLLNPDGYNYSWVEDRNWKKTRSEYRENRCIGADINSNFDLDWGGPGSSSDSCLDNYQGPVVESEPEVYALAELLRYHYYDEFITFHAFGEEILYPYFYSQTAVDNHNNLQYVGRRASEAIFTQYQKWYEVAPGYADLPLKAGKSVDYAYSMGVGLAYQIELRDKGEYGYLLPESEITPTCNEAFAAIDVFAKELFPE